MSRLFLLAEIVLSCGLAQGQWVHSQEGKTDKSVVKEGYFSSRGREQRIELLKLQGGTAESEAAVLRGLKFLLRMQRPDGGWELDDARYGKSKTIKQDIAGTGFALLPMLGAGKTHKLVDAKADAEEKKYAQAIARGLAFLMRNQSKKDGSFSSNMYAHAVATIALCEAYAMTRDEALRRPAQRAVDLLLFAQHDEGGWRYGPKQPGDTSISSWIIMALHSAKVSGLVVPEGSFKKAVNFLDQMCNPDKETYGYLGPGESANLTAAALLCRQYLQSWGPGNPRMFKAVDFLLRTPPSADNMYYTYYATQVMRNNGGRSWKTWNERVLRSLLAVQEKEGPLAGSFPPPALEKNPGHIAGRLMQTSLCLCTLEVYYRHPPLFKKED